MTQGMPQFKASEWVAKVALAVAQHTLWVNFRAQIISFQIAVADMSCPPFLLVAVLCL